MRVQLVTPAPRGSRLGNRVTALRWSIHLRALGHEVRVREVLDDEPADVLVALHAEKSADALVGWRATRGTAPAVLLMTGTDLYGAERLSALTLESCARADRIVVLQPGATERLPEEFHERMRCIPQSAVPPADPPPVDADRFEVLVLAHLRAVKDPLLVAHAARLAPASSRLSALLAGEGLDPELTQAVQAEERSNPRFRWLGPLNRGDALRRLASSRLLVVTSHNEGGPAVVPEAIACGVGVLSTDMAAARALLGPDHPGLFPVGDAPALAALLLRAEEDPAFLELLRAASARLQPEVSPTRERERIAALLAEF